jgi:hypothetical protein
MVSCLSCTSASPAGPLSPIGAAPDIEGANVGLLVTATTQNFRQSRVRAPTCLVGAASDPNTGWGDITAEVFSLLRVDRAPAGSHPSQRIAQPWMH